MIKTEVSYTISNTGRTFHYYYGLLGIVDAWLDYLTYKNNGVYKNVKFKIMPSIGYRYYMDK